MRDSYGIREGCSLSSIHGKPSKKGHAKGGIGYCMSGQAIVSAVGSFPEHFAAGASLYGVGIVTDEEDSPPLLADRMRGELYLGFAEVDHLVPGNVVPELEAVLRKHNVPFECKTFPGTRHGFCFEERAVYHRDSAEEVWGKIFDLFKRRLQ
jgi:carboxymethylenebutenolidase